jgi:hypothetical protein
MLAQNREGDEADEIAALSVLVTAIGHYPQ